MTLSSIKLKALFSPYQLVFQIKKLHHSMEMKKPSIHTKLKILYGEEKISITSIPFPLHIWYTKEACDVLKTFFILFEEILEKRSEK